MTITLMVIAFRRKNNPVDQCKRVMQTFKLLRQAFLWYNIIDLLLTPFDYNACLPFRFTPVDSNITEVCASLVLNKGWSHLVKYALCMGPGTWRASLLLMWFSIIVIKGTCAMLHNFLKWTNVGVHILPCARTKLTWQTSKVELRSEVKYVHH